VAAEPVAIVGMAAIFPGAPDLDTFWSNLVAGVDAVTPVPPERVDHVFFDAELTGRDHFYCDRGGFIDARTPFDPSEFGIMPVTAAGTEPDQLLALATASRALADAGYGDGVPDPERVGVVVGRGGYLTPVTARLEQRVRTAHQLVVCLRELLPDLPADRLDAIRERFQQALGPAHPEASIGLVPNLVASLVANRLDLHGTAFTVDAACASSLVAVAQAVGELQSGRADLMLAGGVHHCHDVTLWSVFTQLRALSPSGEIRPFDRRADGIVIGEGTGIAVLKRLADALRDDDRIYAVVRGVGTSSDGRDATLMSPATEGQVLAISRAWTSAELDPTSVGLVEAHGSATRAGDAAEIATLRRVFEPADGTAAPPVWLGSVKSNIGHAMPASGIAGLIKAALALHHGVVPPTLHCRDPHPDLGPSRFDVVTEPRPWPASGTPRRAGVNAFGFGGINAHVILEGHGSGTSPGAAAPAGRRRTADAAAGATPRPRRRRDDDAALDGAPTRLFVCTGEDPRELVGQLRDGDAVLAGSSLDRLGPAGPVRLAIADPTPKRLELARKVVARGTPWRGRNDVWFAPAGLVAGGGRIVFAYPGVEPTGEPDVDDVAAHFGLDAPDRRELVDLDRQGAGIVDIGRLLGAALARLGVRPDVIVGHSLGEWTAMLESGALEPDVIDTFLSAALSGAFDMPDLVFLAAGCGVDVATDAVAGLPDIAISHDNCPHQVVICGSEASIEAAWERLKQRRVLARTMPFRTGFHTPMFEPYLGAHERVLGDVPFRQPEVELWSSVIAAPFPSEPAAMRDVARRLYVERVRFRELVRNLYAAGARVFVQPGLGSVPSFVADTLHGDPHLTVAAADADRPGMAQVARAAAALFVEGADVRLDLLAITDRAAARVDAPVRVRTSDTGGRRDRAVPGRRSHNGSGVLGFEASLVRGALQPLDPPPGAAVADPLAGLGVSGGLERELEATLRAVTETSRELAAAFAPAARRGSAPAPVRPALPGAPPGGPDGPAPRVPSIPSIPSAGLPAPGATAPVPPASGRPPRSGLPVSGAQAPGAQPAGASPGTPGRYHQCRRLSLETVPELIDHAFFSQPDGAEPGDRFPVVPMTMMIDMFAEAATTLAPGRLVVGLQSVRALRWLAVEPAVDVDIVAVHDGADRVKVSIEGYARGTVLLGDSYAPAPPPDRRPLADETAPPHTAAELYGERWMFHGPAYQGITETTAIGADGIRAAVTALPAPGALLDAAGQLLAYWIEWSMPENRVALPMRIDRIDFHGPHPGPGVRLDCLVRFTEINETDARGDVELVRDGAVWASMHQFVDRRFETTDGVFATMLHPETSRIAERRDGYWIVPEQWYSSATRDLIARRYLGSAEREHYFGLTPKAQREFLLGRIAVKDAVREWLWQRGAGPIFPIEIRVSNDADGRPRVEVPGGRPVRVSLAHRRFVAVAAVGDGVDRVGIDLDVVEPRGEAFERIAMTEDERRLGVGRPHDEWVTTVWTAKEAVSKAAGSGLQGRPKDWQVEEVDGDRLRVGDRWVHVTREGDHIVSHVIEC
jgi:acyl transferase domain-containing protein/phosphopantetheinyl transferase (holo-ACP synthase)